MYHKCGKVQVHSLEPGKPKDLPFSAQEFFNACLLVQSGPFTDENKDWLRVLRMYNRMVLLRVDVLAFCEPYLTPPLAKSKIFEQFKQAAQAPQITHRFGLPLSAQNFLEILDEFREYEIDLRDGIVQSQYAGSKRLFFAMVNDLEFYGINMKGFLTDNVPEHMESNLIFVTFLSTLEGENFQVNYNHFVQAVFDTSPRRITGPMSHFQAAMFVQSLVEIKVIPPPELAQRDFGPHGGLCENGSMPDDFILIGSSCCGRFSPKCCFMQSLMQLGPRCRSCDSNMVDVVQSLPREP
jgi:hypothetical protein